MKGDFSRLTFDPSKKFLRVLQQQGRVQLDADWNEQTAILLHYFQTLAADLIGQHGGPKDEIGANETVVKKNHGFEIITDAERIKKFNELTSLEKENLVNLFGGNNSAIIISPGRYYVDGLLAESDKFFSLYQQPEYPWPENTKLELGNKNYLLYLDVWEKHVTSIEDSSIREVALEGADTTTRAKLVWQVKAKELTSPNDLKDPPKLWQDTYKELQPVSRGLLKARANDELEKSNAPCITSPHSSYRGLENQLYRVEIHIHDKNKAYYKWARDNASTVTKVLKANDNVIKVDNPEGFSTGQWVELTNDEQEQRGLSGPLIKIKKIEGNEIFLDTAIAIPSDASNETWPTKARRWDGGQLEISSTLQWQPLADGIAIQFQPPPNGGQNEYRTGDYWLIPARTATGNVDWPNGEAKPPSGIDHHYAPLAIITPAKPGGGNKYEVLNMRKTFDPWSKIPP